MLVSDLGLCELGLTGDEDGLGEDCDTCNDRHVPFDALVVQRKVIQQ